MTQQRPPVVITAVKSYPPAFRSGGPTRSVGALVEQFHEQVDFRVITSMDDNGHDLRAEGVKPLVWEERGDALVSALPLGPLASLRMVMRLRSVEADVLYLNSLFHPVFSLVPLVVAKLGLARFRRTIISPRGELDAGALAQSPRRKDFVLAILRISRVASGVTWHATSDVEAANIKQKFGDNSEVTVATNLRVLAVADPVERSVEGPLRTVFMSKIDRKKNLETAVAAVSQCVDATLSVIGPIKDEGYWSEVQALVKTSGLADRFNYLGEVAPELVVDRLAEFDAFLLPTHGENFGHAILEALAAGLPVILGNTTPWNHVEAEGAGWVRSPFDEDGFAQCIDELRQLGQVERYQLRKNAARLAEEFVNDPGPIAVYRELFLGNAEVA
jgi:glycosyltransferase involved in cell wall biosynthesis